MNFYSKEQIIQRYQEAKAFYQSKGIQTDAILESLSNIPISLHCWQGDDICGFTEQDESLSGGIHVTGSYPGRARNIAELQNDLDLVFSLIPGKKKLNLHAIYADVSNKKVPRDELDTSHFSSWVEWAKKQNSGLDFNPTLFSHPNATDGLTLSHPDASIRDFWIRHCIACRKIGEHFGKELNTPCITNLWAPDGLKDYPGDRLGPRLRLEKSLDTIFSTSIDEAYAIDSLESKLFGIGSEAYVVGSHEFYMGYGLTRNKMICLDLGHFHPTENIADKMSALLPFTKNVILHLSRPMRWDSDHVVLLDSMLEDATREIVRLMGQYTIHLALDFFDASINRLVAWVVGSRNVQKSLLFAMLDPNEELHEASNSLNFTKQMVLFEEAKTWPRNDIWNYYCLQQNVPVGEQWYNSILNYEKTVLQDRR